MRSTRFSFLAVVAMLVAIFGATTTSAQSLTLINNSGTTSSSWFIDGEPSLVMNGFDLSPLNVTYPITIDAVTIAIQQAVPQEAVQVVIYEDGNGGSPVDATLLYQTSATISTAGVARIPLPNPPSTNAPVLWIGLRLPVGTRFFADEQGSSVLTYWAWTPGSTFDLANLGSAQVFGPADGSEPVGINLGGVARITAEISQASGGTGTSGNAIGGLAQQIPSNSSAALNVLESYPYCGESLFYDPQDIEVTARGAFDIFCRADLGNFSPGTISNEGALPAIASRYERVGPLYEVFVFGDFKADPSDSEKLVVPVTHCIRPDSRDLDTAFLGVGYGAPRAWTILPTQRYGELVCAEVTHQGFLSYFVPRTESIETLNADLQFSGVPDIPFNPITGDGINRILCGFDYIVNFEVYNEGFATTPPTTVSLIIRNDRTGTVSLNNIYTLPPIPPGGTVELSERFVAPDTFVNEQATITLSLDADSSIAERDELNNQYAFSSKLLATPCKQ